LWLTKQIRFNGTDSCVYILLLDDWFESIYQLQPHIWYTILLVSILGAKSWFINRSF
jgi:hypothetical protein